MAHITTDNNYITVLCSKCGQETKVDITTTLSDGIINWCYYHCRHCGHIGKVELKSINREENSLNRIANALEDIRDILKRLDIHRR